MLKPSPPQKGLKAMVMVAAMSTKYQRKQVTLSYDRPLRYVIEVPSQGV